MISKLLKSIKIIGMGGQGIIKISLILAESIFEKGLNVVQTQTYGAEVRRGVVSADVTYETQKDTEIYDLNVDFFDYFLIMAKNGFEKYKSIINNYSTIIFSDSFSIPINELNLKSCIKYAIPDSDVISQLKFRSSLNMCYLGALAKICPDLDIDILKNIITRESSNKYLDDNLESFQIGLDIIKKYNS